MHFPITYAGFFAPANNLFFLLLSFLFCSSLKNDGRVVFVLPWRSDLCTQTCPYRLARLGTSLRVRGKLTLRKKEFIVLKCITWLLPLNDKIQIESCPRLSGKVSAELTKGASVSRHVKWFWPVYANLPLSPRRLGTSLRVRGKLTLRKKAIKFLYSKNKNKEMTHTKKPSPLVGEGGGVSRRKGQVWADMKNSFLQNGIKYLPVILERS